MKISITDCKMVIMLLLIFHNSNAQDWKIIIKDHCNNNLACNPFLSGVTCSTAVIRTTHGSPFYYINGTNKQIALLASTSVNGNQYGEGFTVEYAFQTGKTYTVKIVHQGLPQTGTVSYPRMIAAITNQPPRNNDGCAQGQLNSSSVYTSFEIIVSQAANTSSFTVTPTEPISFLWLRSVPNQLADAGLLITSIEIDDHSVNTPGNPGPGPGGPYACDGSLDFCLDSHNFHGGWDFRVDNSIFMGCNVFKGHELRSWETFLYRRFAAREINLVDGFEATAYTSDPNVPRVFFAMASNTPCNEVLSIHNVNNNVAAPEPMLQVALEPAVNKDRDAEIALYPSLGNGNIRINGNIFSYGRFVITVTDQSGRIVYQKPGQGNDIPIHLNLTHLANGMYFVRINASSKVIVKKIIIKK